MLIRIAVLVLLCASTALAQEKKGDADKTPKGGKEVLTYKDHVAPLLRKHCGNCHNPDKATSDFNVMTYATLMQGGASGEAVQPGSPDQSLLYKVIAHIDEPFMPSKQPKLPDAEIALVKRWIEAGAPETAASAAKLNSRKVELDVTSVTGGKPEGPAPMPEKLAAVDLPKVLRPHPVTAMAASPWAPLVAVAGHERISLYNTETLQLIGMLPFPERIPHVLKFSRNGKILLAGGGHGADSGKVVLFDVVTGQRLQTIGEEADSVLAADISPDHKWVALGGPAKLVKIFDSKTGELKHKIKKHTDWVTSMEFSPSGDYLATGDRNGGVYVWEAETGGIIFTLGDHKDCITGLSWRADSQMLASSSEDGRVILWYAEDGFPTRTINATSANNAAKIAPPRGKSLGATGVEYARNGLIATVGRDRSAKVWSSDGSSRFVVETFSDIPTRVVLTHEGERMIVGDYTGKVQVWNVKEKKLIGDLAAK